MKFAIAVLVLLAAAAFTFAAYLGAFQSIDVVEQSFGPYTFAYREMQGTDAKQIGEITTALDSLLKAHGDPKRKPFDVFFPGGKAQIGFIVEGTSIESLVSMGDLHARVLPAQTYISTEFPHRNMLSFIVGYMRVDPAFTKHRDAHGYAMAEAIAIDEGAKIVYLQTIRRNGPAERM